MQVHERDPAGAPRYARLVAGVSPLKPSGKSASAASSARAAESRQAIRMAADRVLARKPDGEGERKSRGGLVIPATAASENRRLVWAEVAAVGPNVHHVEIGDHVLILPDRMLEVELHGEEYWLVRERDIQAIASDRIEGTTGLYL